MTKTNKSMRKICLSLLTLALFLSHTFAQEKRVLLDSLLTYYYENGRFNGVALIAEEGKVSYHKAFGFADFEDKAELDTSAVFNVASITKPFTALAIMKLKEQGQLSYSDKLIKYFPDFQSVGSDITIHNLLTHSSGIKDYENELHLRSEIRLLTTKFVYDSLRNQKELNFNPGERYSYSNSGYFLLALIIEKVSGKSYKEFIEENIFRPLDMEHSFVLDESNTEIPGRVKSYTGFWQENEDDLDCRVPGDGNIYTSAMDLLRFEQSFYGNKVIQPETLKSATDTADFPTIRPGLKYGYGWMLEKSSAGTSAYHSGGQGGFRSWIWRNPDTHTTLIILSNTTFLADCKGVLSETNKIMKGQCFSLNKIPITELFYEKYFLKGFGLAMKSIRQEKNKANTLYSFPEQLINNLALDFLFLKNNPAAALELFKFNVELYPDSWNAWDSLGETYYAAKNNELARQAFEKSVKLNPKNTSAQEKLKKLMGGQ